MKALFLVFLPALFSCTPDKSKSTSTKEIGGLTLPDSLQVAVQINEKLPNGDGILIYNYKINHDLFESVKSQLQFHPLPFKPNEVVDNRIYDFMTDEDNGYYSTSQLDDNDPRDQLIILLNETRMELTILMAAS